MPTAALLPAIHQGRVQHLASRCGSLLLILWLMVAPVFAAQINPPIGEYVDLHPADFEGATSYTAEDRVVVTPYFYWYDVFSGAHIYNPDGTDALTTHPPTLTGFSYLSRAWHRQQLLDMIDAGIDVVMPVYWGEPSQRLPDQPVALQPWSYAGLPPLVRARDELLAEGKQPPRIGLFYDTSTLEWNVANRQIDLTTEHGRQWFYESIRDFFSLIPPRHWAMIDDRPIVFLYAAGFAADHDQAAFDYTQQAFAADFGGRTPYIVREISWNVQTDQVYAWGGALGLKNPGVASLGPGYDHSAVPGRDPLIVDREDGAFFERNWIRFLRNPSHMVMIETWNEFHEATDIAASKEYGRQYIELNREFVDLFKAGIRPPLPRGPYSDSKSVHVTLGITNTSHGLVQFDHADGLTQPLVVAERECRAVVPTEHGGRYIYLRLDDSFKWADSMMVDLEVEYFDSGSGSFHIQYDGSDPNAPFQGAYTASSQSVTLTGTDRWKTARFRLLAARFLNSQNGGADLRIATGPNPLHVHRIIVRRLGLPEEAGADMPGWQDTFTSDLDANWEFATSADPTFRSSAGLLSIRHAQPAPIHALASTIDEATNIELLARIRVKAAPAPGSLGGLVLGATSNPQSGLHFQFIAGTNGTSRIGLDGPGLQGAPGATFAWDTNRWYWLRLRHQTNSLTGYPDLWARIWPADGETPEPVAWNLYWDYFPNHTARRGRPGFVSGSVPGGALECDYLLVKRNDLPLITAILPQLKPARPHLAAVHFSEESGLHLTLDGDPDVHWILQSSTNLRSWTDLTSIWSTAGPIAWNHQAANTSSHQFYRVRHGP
jgi:hypothetical protein